MRTAVKDVLHALRNALQLHECAARWVRAGKGTVNERLIAYERVRVQAERLAFLLQEEEKGAGEEVVL